VTEVSPFVAHPTHVIAAIIQERDYNLWP